jgi:fructokinase
MDRKYDISAIGECLIDFVPSKEQEEGKLAFSGCTGGAPSNMLACASLLGLDTALISKVGDDVFRRTYKGYLVQKRHRHIPCQNN